MATSFHTNLTFIFNLNTYFQSSKNLSTEKRVALLEFYSQTSLRRYRYFFLRDLLPSYFFDLSLLSNMKTKASSVQYLEQPGDLMVQLTLS